MKITKIKDTEIRRVKNDDGTVYAIIGEVKELLENEIIFSDNTVGNENKWLGIEESGELIREFNSLDDAKIITVHYNHAPNGVMLPKPVASRDKCRARQHNQKPTTKGNNKMKTSQVKSYYERYMYAVNKYGYRNIFDCYNKPSWAKIRAEREIVEECINKGGYAYSVISYNTSIFTCGYLFRKDGELWFVVHTPSDYGKMKVEED